jgi:predicted AAA+ superfamily ATPase
LIKDVARQAGINDIPLLEHIAKLVSYSIGTPLSPKKICSALNIKGRKIAISTVETYIQALASAFVFYHAERFDIKTGKRLKTLGKYYIADTGIRNILLESPPSECAERSSIDGQLENLVCMELLRRGFQVCIGKHGSDEISFVAFQTAANGGMTTRSGSDHNLAYFQVAASLRDADILAKKISPLNQIQDQYPKYLLSLDENLFRSRYNGIVQKNIVDWLLETNSKEHIKHTIATTMNRQGYEINQQSRPEMNLSIRRDMFIR